MQKLFNNKKDCCGCTACKSICPTGAITIKADKHGFLYPKIDQQKCIDCGMCKKVCAFQNGYKKNEKEYPEVWAVKHKNSNVLKTSTSGGAFTAISDYILDLDGVVYGVAFDNDLNVSHEKATTKQEREKFKGSKYSQSNLKNIFLEIKKYLKNDKLVLFTGTPCQNEGLNSFLMNSNINTEKLILCDLICHGTPSPLLWKEYINFCEKKNKSKIVEYHHRSKVHGWGKGIYIESAKYKNGKTDCTSYLSQMYKKFFSSCICFMEACYVCPYTNLNRPSDITIADFWGIEKCLPEFNDKRGVSLVLVNSQKGKNIFKNIKNNIEYIQSNKEDCLQWNLQHPTPMPQNTKQFWTDYENKGFKYILKKYAGYNIIKYLGRKVKKLIR